MGKTNNPFNKKYGLPYSALRIDKRKKLTVDQLLTKDSINDTFNEANEIKQKLKGVIIIGLKEDDTYQWFTDDVLLTSQAVWLLECMKYDLLNNNEE